MPCPGRVIIELFLNGKRNHLQKGSLLIPFIECQENWNIIGHRSSYRQSSLVTLPLENHDFVMTGPQAHHNTCRGPVLTLQCLFWATWTISGWRIACWESPCSTGSKWICALYDFQTPCSDMCINLLCPWDASGRFSFSAPTCSQKRRHQDCKTCSCFAAMAKQSNLNAVMRSWGERKFFCPASDSTYNPVLPYWG